MILLYCSQAVQYKSTWRRQMVDFKGKWAIPFTIIHVRICIFKAPLPECQIVINMGGM